MKAAIHEAKAKLSALINAALSGEQVIMTRHGRPVAEITPLAPAKKPAEKLSAIRKITARASTRRLGGVPAAESDNFLYDDAGLPS